MNNFKKYSFAILSIFSLFVNSQAIDESILSQLNPDQIEKAKDLYASSNNTDTKIEELSPIDESLINKESVSDANNIPGKKYGYDFFLSMPTSLTAVGDLPLPNNYKISLRDQFTVILTGSKDAIFNLNVKLDGTILFPELGSISVAGLTFQEVKDKLTKLIEQSYIGVTIDISLQNLSAKKITIVGAVKTPGTYLVNPFTTITGALAYSGGISEIGSLRDIKLIRNNTEIFSFDLYDLLIKGDRSNDITIEAGDTLLISAANQFVEIVGAVKRPAIYEVLEGETFNNLVDFALGFNQTANKSNISASFLNLDAAKIAKKNIKSLDESLANVLTVQVFNYVNEKIANVQVLGAIDQPGFYDLVKYSNLNDLIEDLNFIDVYPWLAVLEQFDDNNLVKSTTLFSLNDKSTYEEIDLLPNSRLYFANIEDRSFDVSAIASNFIDEYSLELDLKNNNYRLPVIGKYSVNSFINLLGLDMSNVDINATYISPIDNIVIVEDYRKMEFVAKKYDNISFRAPINDLIRVNVSGAVSYPGTYTLKSDSTLDELYSLVGSFKSEAFFDGIILKRDSIREQQLQAIERSESALNKSLLISSQENDLNEISTLLTLAESIEPKNLGRIGGDFSPVSNSPKETILFDGDEIIIPKLSNVINIIGAVLNPIAFEFNDKLTIDSAIDQAGGFQSYADKKRVYVIKANGMIERTGRNVFVRGSNLKPGDTIVVPRKVGSSGLSNLIPVTQILSDLAFSAAAIDNLSNN